VDSAVSPSSAERLSASSSIPVIRTALGGAPRERSCRASSAAARAPRAARSPVQLHLAHRAGVSAALRASSWVSAAASDTPVNPTPPPLDPLRVRNRAARPRRLLQERQRPEEGQVARDAEGGVRERRVVARFLGALLVGGTRGRTRMSGADASRAARAKPAIAAGAGAARATSIRSSRAAAARSSRMLSTSSFRLRAATTAFAGRRDQTSCRASLMTTSS